MSQFFTSGGQSIGASASASVPPLNIQDCNYDTIKTFVVYEFLSLNLKDLFIYLISWFTSIYFLNLVCIFNSFFILFFGAALCGMQGLTSLMRDRSHTHPAVEAPSLNHRAAREVPISMYFLRDIRIGKKPRN